MIIVAIVIVALVLLLLFSAIFLKNMNGESFLPYGRFWKVKGFSLIIVVPIIEKIVRTHLRIVVMDVPSQDMISRDNVSVRVNAVVYFQVIDPKRAIIQVKKILRSHQSISTNYVAFGIGKY